MRPETATPPSLDYEAQLPSYLETPGRFILHLAMRRRWHVVSLFGLAIIMATCGVGVQYVLKLLVDALNGPRGVSEPIVLALGLFVALSAGESICNRLTGWLACRTTVNTGVDLRLELFQALSGQSMRYFAENLAGSLGQRITATAGNLGALTNTLVWRIIPPSIDLLGAIVIFGTINLGMTATLAVSVILVTAGLIWFGERGRDLHRDYSGEAASTNGDLVDTITNMWTVKAFSARRREWRRLATRFRREADKQRTSWMHLEKARAIHDVALLVMSCSMLVWIVMLWSAGKASAGDVVIVFSLTFRILHSSKDMALSLIDVAQQFAFVDETLAVIGQSRSVYDLPHAPALVCRDGQVEFKGVGFGYPNRRRAVSDIDLVIPGGQKVGIVGPSGAGKSTVVHLLQRLYDVEDGEITIDGQPIRLVAQDTLRSAMAVVPQEITLLHRSLMDNIRFARPGATDEEVMAASKAAACDGFIRALPQGYDTLVGERGAKLSGGQRQRIGIARAFLKDAPIIIFDEATSALDTESELDIQRSLVSLMRHRTVIAVAHRLSTLTNFDRIIVMDHGRILEDGTFAELRRRGGLFDRMWRLQAAGMTEDIVDAA